MVVVKLGLLFSLVLSFSAWAGEIENAYREKDYERVTNIYKQNKTYNFSQRESLYISSSLRKLGFFRQEIRLNLRLLKKRYVEAHRKLMSDIKKGETVDGDEYQDGQKILYWNILSSYALILKGYDGFSPLQEKDLKTFNSFYQILSELEFRTAKVDKTNDLVLSHIQYLQDKIYRTTGSFVFSYISWQREAALINKAEGREIGLVITNQGYCIGAEAGVENRFYHFYVDGCVMFGSGSVSAFGNTNVNYQQSSVPGIGFKVGPGASLVVGSSKSRIGLRVPVIYTTQSLSTPGASGWTLDKGPDFQFIPSLYSRWSFEKWYLQTEFGQYLGKEETLWSFGIGKNF